MAMPIYGSAELRTSRSHTYHVTTTNTTNCSRRYDRVQVSGLSQVGRRKHDNVHLVKRLGQRPTDLRQWGTEEHPTGWGGAAAGTIDLVLNTPPFVVGHFVGRADVNTLPY